MQPTREFCHPRNQYSWARSADPDQFCVLTDLDQNRANDVSWALRSFGIPHEREESPKGTYQVRIEGAPHVRLFDSALPAEQWAKNTIALAYDHTQRQPVEGGIALMGRHGGGPEKVNMDCISFALAEIGITHGKIENGRIGSYYAITNPSDVAKIKAIHSEKHRNQAINAH